MVCDFLGNAADNCAPGTYVCVGILCISGWLSVRNRQCSYKQDATSHTKSCTCIYSVVIPIQLNREMASVYSSFSHFSLTTNLKYTSTNSTRIVINFVV